MFSLAGAYNTLQMDVQQIHTAVGHFNRIFFVTLTFSFVESLPSHV